MKGKNFNLLLIFLFLFSVSSFAQTEDRKFISPSYHNLNFDLQAGTSFGTSFGYGSAFSTYFMPTLRKPLNPKLSINTGVLFRNNQFNNFNFYPTMEGFSSNLQMNSFTYFVNAEQQLSEKLFISGTAFYEKNYFNHPLFNNNQKDFNSKGLMMDFNYKINKNISIGAGFRYSDSNNSMMNLYNPYLNPYSNFVPLR